jgi:hypothetical protein
MDGRMRNANAKTRNARMLPLASGRENKPGFPIFRFLLFFFKS